MRKVALLLLLFCLPLLAQSEPSRTGLVLQLSGAAADNPTSGQMADLSGNGFNAVLTNGTQNPSWVSFVSTGQAFSVGPDIHGTAATMVVAFRPDYPQYTSRTTPQGNSGGNIGALIGYGDLTNDFSLQYTASAIHGAVSNSGENVTIFTPWAQIIPNQFCVVALTMDGNQMKLYVNGRLASVTTSSLPIRSLAAHQITLARKAGSYNKTGGDAHADFAWVNVYNRALSDAEQQAEYSWLLPKLAALTPTVNVSQDVQVFPPPLPVPAIPVDLPTPINIVYDGNIGSYLDDAYPVYFLLQLQKLGIINVLALTVDNSIPYACAATQAFTKAFQLDAIPIGSCSGSCVAIVGDSYAQSVAQQFLANPQMCSSYPSGTTVLRQALHNTADGSVVLIGAGYSTTLNSLLNSSADAIDSRTGSALIAAKVQRTVFMSGGFPSGTEGNLQADPVSAANLAANWPIPIYYIGGFAEYYGGPEDYGCTNWGYWCDLVSSGNPYAMLYIPIISNPLAWATAFTRTYNGLGAVGNWGEAAILAGVGLTNTNYFRYGGRNGTLSIDTATGRDVWSATPVGTRSFMSEVSSGDFPGKYQDILWKLQNRAPLTGGATGTGGNALWFATP